MRALFIRIALTGACLLAGLSAAHADTAIRQFKAFAGNINFTGTQKTMRTKSNTSDPCSVDTGTLNMELNSQNGGLPSGSVVLSAHLYWAGSSTTPDYEIEFDGEKLTAPVSRQFTTSTTGSVYFSGAVDVTRQVTLKRNAIYTVGGLAIDASSTYCNSQAVLGGFQLLVVYSLPSETFRVLNIYEGLQYVHNSSATLILSNFQIPNPIGSVTGRVGHITWEGDSTLNDNEYLQYNGVAMQDSMNNGANQFNSASNINADSASYGIDFDAYTVSSPVIKGGDTQASTTYRSGQDLVVMSAEIIAAPNVPATDRTITMTLNNTLTPSLPSTYSITVGNNGPLTETGPIVVKDTLPSSLIFTSASGNGWTCGAVGQAVTCTYTGPSVGTGTSGNGTLAAGFSLPVIALKVTPAANAVGLISNSARVNGSLFDYDDSNNTATVSVRVGQAAFQPVYVFTDTVCVHGEPFGSANQPCKRISLDGKRIIANTEILMYLTYTVNDVPTSLATTDTTLPMKFALTCHDPGTANGRRATFNVRGTAKYSLELCAANGVVPDANSAVWGNSFRDVVLPANLPTSQSIYSFNYTDVGRIELLAIDNVGKLGSTYPFVSRPNRLNIPAVKSYGFASPEVSSLAGNPTASLTDGRFVPAGQNFQVKIEAMSGGTTEVITPNFGRENSPTPIVMMKGVATDATGNYFTDMLASLNGGDPASAVVWRGALGAFSNGVASGQFAYDDVGIVRLTVTATDYLGTGDVNAVPVNIGRFYPHHFDTLAVAPMSCIAWLTCPANTAGAAYSRQPFGLQLIARSASGTTTRNYQNTLARTIQLDAYSAAQGTSLNPPSSPAGSSLALTSVASTAFVAGVAANLTETYRFPAANAWVSTAPGANNWVKPTAVYIRASETSGDDVSSQATGAMEAGIMVISGRLVLGNAYGSDRTYLPVPMTAQYYSPAGTWLNTVGDGVSTLTLPTNLSFSNCKRNQTAVSCPYTVKYTAPSQVLTMDKGQATVSIMPPGASNYGSGDLKATAPVWLPSGVARLTFGNYHAQYIYLREMH